MSPSSPRPYKSRLFNLINHQSMQWRDRVGQAVRHLRVAAEWGVQALVFPLLWFIQNGRGGVNPLGTGTREQHHSLGSAATTEEEEETAIALYDRPLTRILTVIEPWLAETAIAPAPLSSNQPSATPARSPWTKLWEKVEQLNPFVRHGSPRLLSAAPETPADHPLSRSQFLALVQEPTFAEGHTNPAEWWVQGIATHLSSRRVVLVTSENQTLDLLTDPQQKRLQKRIRLEMANYRYDHRRQLAPQQKVFGLIPAVSSQSGEVLPPVELFWQSLRWWETQEIAIAVEQWTPSALVHSPVTALPQTLQTLALQSTRHWPIAAHLAQSNRSVAALPASELPVISVAPEPLNPSLLPQAFPLTDLLRAAIHYFFGSTAQTSLPPSPESLAAASMQQSLPLPSSIRLLQQQLPPVSVLSPARLIAPVKALLGSPVDNRLQIIDPINAIAPSSPDPFQIKYILQAAIEDFLRPSEIATPQPNPSVQAIVADKLRSLLQKFNPAPSSIVIPSHQEQTAEDPWLMWEDLFPEPVESSPSTSLSARGVAALPSLPSTRPTPALERLTDAFRKNLKRSQSSKALQKQSKKSQNLAKKQVSPENQLKKSQFIASSLADISKNNPTVSQTAIDFDPDWIEIGAESVGYVKHPLEIILEILDGLILGLEKILLWLWHRIKNLIPSV